jgi:hypothetical protein
VPALPSVVITSELDMVAEAVAVGLAHRGFAATRMRWPTEQRKPGRLAAASAGQRGGLLISDFDTWERLQAAWLLITRAPLRWVVLTRAPRGPTWGAVLEAGACLVLPSTTGLEAVCRAVDGAASGAVHMEPREQGRRMRALRKRVLENDVDAWSSSFHRALSEVHPR